jgi:hypothetical protein
MHFRSWQLTAKTTFGCQKKMAAKNGFWQSLLAEFVETILRPKLLAERIAFGRILPKPVLAAKFFGGFRFILGLRHMFA